MPVSPPTFRVYSAAPLLRQPGVLLRDMLRDLRLSIPLSWQLAGRDIKAQFRQSLLGYLWALLPPLLIAGSFILLKDHGVISAAGVRAAYGAYVIVGVLLWQIFADAFTAPLRLVTANRDVLVRVNFPREALVLAGVLTTGFSALIRLLVIAALPLFYPVAPTPQLMLVPVGILTLILAGTCVGLWLTPLGVLYRDIEKALPLLLTLWMLLTPVAYPISAADSGWLAFNFVSPLIEATRNAFTGDMPQGWGTVAAVSSAAFLGLLAGWLLMRLATPHLVARLGL